MQSLILSLLNLAILVSWIPPGIAKFHYETQKFIPSKPLPDNSYFGFSTTYQPDIKSLIISAPNADNIGQIFNCNVDGNNCALIESNITRENSLYTHKYWLGATVKAGPDFFLTCAPLTIHRFDTTIGTHSTCFKVTSNKYASLPSISDNDRTILTSPNKDEHKMDSFGWSIDIGKSNKYLFGGPAMFSGRVMIGDPAETMNYEAIIGKQYDINYNFGYSVAFGSFFNSEEYYAIGSPYGAVGSGKVDIFSFKVSGLKIKQELREKYNSVGSMFGAVLCSARLVTNTDTLFVGAPAQAEGYNFNMGAVYVYHKINKRKLSVLRVIKGLENGGQFGSAIVNIGDINGDKINDIAISAPYENNGQGAVYLYCGASIADSSISTLTPLQKLQATSNMTFGLSLAVLSDHDENGCNELAVGAPGEGAVVLHKCITEIPITLDVEFPPLKKRDDITSFTFKSCFTVSYPPKLKKVTGKVKINLAIIHEQAQLANSMDAEYEEELMDVNKNRYCRDVKVLTPVEGNYNREISYQMTATIKENPEEQTYDPSRVMFSDRSELIKKGSVRAANCTNDNECVPKLDVTITASKKLTGVQPYTIGSSEFESFTVSITNEGDTAYEMCTIVRLEGPVIYQTPRECSRVDNQLTCAPHQALRDQPWILGPIDMQMDKLTSENRNLIIHVDLFDDCKNQSQQHDKSKSLTIPLTSSTDFAIKGYTDIYDIVNMTENEIKLFGKKISHVYTINNNGPTTWMDIKYTLTFKKELYIDQSVASNYVTYARSSETVCTLPIVTKDEEKVTCSVQKVPGGTQKQIIVPINILPGKLEILLDGVNETAVTHCSLDFDNTSFTASITTTLTEGKMSVPLWIILAACFVGLLIVLLLVLILVECGFMRRKNKDRLKDLKKDVRRQTIRRSMMQTEDRQRLVEEREDNEPSCSINHPEDPTREVTFHQSPAKECDLQENIENIENGHKKNPMLKELNERLVQFK